MKNCLIIIDQNKDIWDIKDYLKDLIDIEVSAEISDGIPFTYYYGNFKRRKSFL